LVDNFFEYFVDYIFILISLKAFKLINTTMTVSQTELVRALKEPSAYQNSPKTIKLRETLTSFLFKADDQLFKIKKSGNEYASLAVKEAFCHEECRLSQRFNPNWPIEVLPVMEHNGELMIGGTEGEIIEYALKMEVLSDQWSLSQLLAKDKVTAKHISKIATRIAEIHAASPAKDRAAESGKPEPFRALCDDMLFQLKRYFETSLTQPILDMIRHPLEKFIDDNKRLFNKRQKKGRIVFGHGAFLPEHIFVHGDQVYFISPQEVQKKLAVLDVANDVSSLTVELARMGKTELFDTFLEQYLEVSKDQDLLKMLPLYQTYCALKQGVKTCELKVAQQNDELGNIAMDYFNLAVRFSREIPRV
jgi:aminoglycoside phosphotransferase family enzyme